MATRALVGLAGAAGLNAIARHQRRGSLLVLAYHGVVSRAMGHDRDRYRNTVSREEFDYQLSVISRLFNPIGVRQLLAALGDGPPLPDRAALVTFDDGYRNNLTHAAPLLEKHGVPALVNVATGYIGRNEILWPDEIVLRLEHWPHPVVPMPPDGRPLHVARDRHARAAAAHRARERCKRIPDAERLAYLELLRREPLGTLDEDDEERLAFMDWDDVRALSRRGFDIGSHTVDHPILSRVAPALLARQLEESRARIEHETGRPCTCIAYPNGQPADVSPDVEAAAARAGYLLGFTVRGDGINGTCRNPFGIARVCIPGHAPRSAFHARISGVHAALERVVRRSAGRGRAERPRSATEAAVPSGVAPPLETRLLTRFEELDALAPEWDRLWCANPAAEIFSSFRWIRAWWRAYGHSRVLCAPAVFDEGRLIGVLPLALDGKLWRFVGAPGADYNDVLCEPGRGAEVVRETVAAALGLVEPSQRCELENLSETSTLAAHVAALPERVRERLQVRWSGPCPTVDLSTGREEIVRRILAKESLRRHRNRLERAGRLEFRHLDDREEIERHLPGFYRAHMTRWAVAGQRSSFLKPEARALCEALVEELDPCGTLRFGVLSLDGRPIAYHFGFESRRKFIWYKPAFDVDYWDFSPGEVLIGRLFEYARNRQLDEFDFTRGGESAKHRFANRVRQQYTVELFPPGVRGAVRHRLYGARERLKHEHPALFAALKRTAAAGSGWSVGARAVLRASPDGLRPRFPGSSAYGASGPDELLVYVDDLGVPSGSAAGPFTEGIEIRRGSLADLAEASVAHPECFDTETLARARERLKRGDVLYAACCDGQATHFQWTGVRDGIEPPEGGSSAPRIPLPSAAMVADAAWTAPEWRGRGLHAVVMRAVLADARGAGLRQWACCGARDDESRRTFEENGYRLVYRLRRTGLLAREWTSVTAAE